VVSGCMNRYVIERLHTNAPARKERRAQTPTPGTQAKSA
jgi:hypothetical protein